MVEENPESSTGQPPKSEELLHERWFKEFKNIRVVAASILVGSIALPLLIYANSFHDQWVKMTFWIRPQTFTIRVNFIFNAGIVPAYFLIKDYDDFAVCNAPVLLNLTISSLQTNPATIDNYTVEALDVNGKWIRLPRITMTGDLKLYVYTPQRGLDHVRQATTDPPPLDTQLSETSILKPHEPLGGMVQYPFTSIRVTVRDTLGNAFTSDRTAPRSHCRFQRAQALT